MGSLKGCSWSVQISTGKELQQKLCSGNPTTKKKWGLLGRVITKGGHPKFKSATPQIADNQIDRLVADYKKVAELGLQTFNI